MFEKDKSIPPLSSFELYRQASIQRNLVIQACLRTAVRACATWSRMILREGARLARRFSAERRRRSAIRELQRLDDRTLKDIGVRRGEIEFGSATPWPPRSSAYPLAVHWLRTASLWPVWQPT
jgi:uncharacterized protein YjiS (DUF1127 family)